MHSMYYRGTTWIFQEIYEHEIISDKWYKVKCSYVVGVTDDGIRMEKDNV